MFVRTKKIIVLGSMVALLTMIGCGMPTQQLGTVKQNTEYGEHEYSDAQFPQTQPVECTRYPVTSCLYYLRIKGIYLKPIGYTRVRVIAVTQKPKAPTYDHGAQEYTDITFQVAPPQIEEEERPNLVTAFDSLRRDISLYLSIHGQPILDIKNCSATSVDTIQCKPQETTDPI